MLQLRKRQETVFIIPNIITFYNLKTDQITVNSLQYTPGTAGGPGGRDRTLAVKSRKND